MRAGTVEGARRQRSRLHRAIQPAGCKIVRSALFSVKKFFEKLEGITEANGEATSVSITICPRFKMISHAYI